MDGKQGRGACLLGLDLGTSAFKGVLMSGDGTLLRTGSRAVCHRFPAPGRVELDPGEQWRALTGLLRELAATAPLPVAGLALAAAAGNTLLTDENGAPLAPVISWLDRRAAAGRLPLLRGLEGEEVRRVTGWPCLDSFPLAHLAWLRAHEPGLLERAAGVGMDIDWLLWRLTGRRTLDHSTASTVHLQDQPGRRWHQPFLERLGLAAGQLPLLLESGAPAGTLTAAAAAAAGLAPGLPVSGGCFDHPAAARAAGVLAPGQLLLSCGTSWVGLLPHGDRGAIIGEKLLCDPFLTARGGPWAGMFSLSRLGETIAWYVEQVIAPGAADPWRVFDELAAAAPPAAGPVIDFERPTPPPAADRRRVSRAVMEGAAALLADRLDRLRARGFRCRQAVLVGGPCRSRVWPRVIAEKTGLALSVGSVYTGARGAAVLAGIGAGLFRDEAAALAAFRAAGTAGDR